MSGVVLWRKATESDAGELAGIAASALAQLGVDVSTQSEPSGVSLAPDFSSQLTLVGSLAGRSCGFVTYGRSGQIERLFVEPDAQRLGIASTLMGQAEVDLGRIGLHDPHIALPESAQSAQAFFAQRGYTAKEETKLKLGNVTLAARRYQKQHKTD